MDKMRRGTRTESQKSKLLPKKRKKQVFLAGHKWDGVNGNRNRETDALFPHSLIVNNECFFL